jgi:polyribonucleotide nucleotidyltransferase
VVNIGDQVKVKVLGFDDRGKVKLSMRVVDQATGEDITEKVGAKPGRGGERDRGERRDRYEGSPVPEGAEQPVVGE